MFLEKNFRNIFVNYMTSLIFLPNLIPLRFLIPQTEVLVSHVISLDTVLGMCPLKAMDVLLVTWIKNRCRKMSSWRPWYVLWFQLLISSVCSQQGASLDKLEAGPYRLLSTSKWNGEKMRLHGWKCSKLIGEIKEKETTMNMQCVGLERWFSN